jgi:hypothetical protein
MHVVGSQNDTIPYIILPSYRDVRIREDGLSQEKRKKVCIEMHTVPDAMPEPM